MHLAKVVYSNMLKQLLRKPCLLILFMVVYSCNSVAQTESTERSTDPTGNHQIIIKFGQMDRVAAENLSVIFVAVLEDSRCPEGVQCVWAGNARIALTVVKTGHTASSLELNTNDRFAVEAQYLEYVIKLIDLKPYPKEGVQIKKQDYTVIVTVRKP